MVPSIPMSVAVPTAAVAHVGEGREFAAVQDEEVVNAAPSVPARRMLTLVWLRAPTAGEERGTVGAEGPPVHGTLVPEATEARRLWPRTPRITSLRSPTPRLKTRP